MISLSGMRHAWLVGLLVLAGAPSARVAAADPPSWGAVRAAWNRPAVPFRVLGNVYFVGTRELGSWLIRTSDGLILLDGALPESVPLIERNIRRLGFRVRDIRLLINSHAHFDHSGGFAQLKRDSGAQLLASEGDRVSLETGTYLGSEDVTAMSAPPVKVDRVIADGEAVRLGDTTLTALVMPGHTRGCTSWTLPVRDQGVVRQVIFYCSTTVGANRLAPNPQYPGIVDDYRATFARLESVHADVFLSNHQDFIDLWPKRARMGKGKPNPFIDPTALPAFVAASRAEFEKELAAQQQAATRAQP
jgi:metallo-beta-lactamase class B